MWVEGRVEVMGGGSVGQRISGQRLGSAHRALPSKQEPSAYLRQFPKKGHKCNTNILLLASLFHTPAPPSRCAEAGGVRGLAGIRLQTSGTATSESLLRSGATVIPTLAQVSLCLHVRPLHLTRSMPLVSYKVKASPKELYLELDGTAGRLAFECCGGSVKARLKVPLRLYEWQPLCLVLHLLTRNLTFVYDTLMEQVGLEVDISKLGKRGLEVEGGGEMTVGQSANTLEGQFDLSQSLHAEVADLRLYDTALTTAQIESFTGCFKDELLLQTPELMSLEQGSFEVRGPTEEIEVSAAEVCGSSKKSFAMLFPKKKNFKEAVYWCEKFRGQVALPTSGPENQDIFNRFVQFSKSCQDMWQGLYWVGARGDLTTGQWLSLRDRQPLAWHNLSLASSSVTEHYQCIMAGSALHPYEWYHAPCSVSTCSVCSFTAYPLIHMRGLCRSSLFDRSMYLHEYLNDQPMFDGAVHSRVAWVDDAWVIESRLYPKLRARILEKVDYPLGLHMWEVEGDKCPHKKIELLLTACRKDEFTCNDGTCIDSWRRCDLSTDCPDDSDELTCEVVKTAEGYNPSLPPPRQSSRPLALYLYLNITSVRKFDVQTFSLAVDTIITLRWNESRVIFLNLQQDYRRNKIKDQYKMWTPKLVVIDGTNSWVQGSTSDGSDLYVERLTQPEDDDDSYHHEEDTYKGSYNSLVYQMHKSLYFRCDLDLQWYPFDSQRCRLYFTVQDLTDSSGRLVKDGPGLEFSGTRQLLEYNLVDEALVDVTVNEVTSMKLNLKFINLYKYYAMNAFLPSLMMVVISYSTLFFHIDDFELVLASFFSQGSLTIPKTSYLKLIDVWYVSLISQVFIVIISLVLIENLRLHSLKAPTGQADRPWPDEGKVRLDVAIHSLPKEGGLPEDIAQAVL
ncbi:hypothetical protein O3P69_005914 [Scylla paramamosain]|uniref:Pentraxin (PTX) domain-containing protein n=1 Tax=Scylla paramamosain TaxID=85552 RepID=A0AAW0U4W1_SCYPA